MLQESMSVSTEGVPFSFTDTTCGRDAFLRGPGQKVVGFSFYNYPNAGFWHSWWKNKRKGFFQGIIGNLELMPIFYPGWIMRLYFDLEEGDPIKKVWS